MKKTITIFGEYGVGVLKQYEAKALTFDLDGTLKESSKPKSGFKGLIYDEVRNAVVYPHKLKVLRELKKKLTASYKDKPLTPGAENILCEAYLKDLPFSLVTTWPEFLLEELRANPEFNDILSLAHHKITGDKAKYVRNGKNPELYKMSLDKFGLKGNQVVGFADSYQDLCAMTKNGIDINAVHMYNPNLDPKENQEIARMTTFLEIPTVHSLDQVLIGK